MSTRVAVLRGGVGDEHEVSMNSGSVVLSHLLQSQEHLNIKPLDVFIDRREDWFVRGIKQTPEQALFSMDVVWNALHGEYGEDGTVQRILDRVGIPYTGSTAYASALSMNKVLAKEILAKAGVRTPRSLVLGVSATLEKDIVSAFRSFIQPSVIKPDSSGSSVGVTIARSYHDFEKGVRTAFQHSPRVLIEEMIVGKEATIGVVEQFRDEPLYSLPPVEIIPDSSSSFFDYQAKYGGHATERCPGNFSKSEVEELRQAALTAHRVLGLRHYSRSDFIVSPTKGVYYLETNALPGTTNESLLPKSLSTVGVPLPEFIDHVLNLALRE